MNSLQYLHEFIVVYILLELLHLQRIQGKHLSLFYLSCFHLADHPAEPITVLCKSVALQNVLEISIIFLNSRLFRLFLQDKVISLLSDVLGCDLEKEEPFPVVPDEPPRKFEYIFFFNMFLGERLFVVQFLEFDVEFGSVRAVHTTEPRLFGVVQPVDEVGLIGINIIGHVKDFSQLAHFNQNIFLQESVFEVQFLLGPLFAELLVLAFPGGKGVIETILVRVAMGSLLELKAAVVVETSEEEAEEPHQDCGDDNKNPYCDTEVHKNTSYSL